MRILSRASDLARLQAMLVASALQARWPGLRVELLTRTAAGDRDTATPLATLTDKGAFTADLSDALITGDADLVVHSWKDLPLEGRPGTLVAATLERADPRDVLLVRREIVTDRADSIDILSSSPRRAWLLEQALPELLPWRPERLTFSPVRGNVPTRLARLIEGRGDALVVAKAALDRLLGFGPPFEEAAQLVRQAIDRCFWMVLPVRDVPGAPAQGALAIEAARDTPLADQLRTVAHEPTWTAVSMEREVLAARGGGCHEALGVTVLPREYGRVRSIKGRSDTGTTEAEWSLLDPAGSRPAAAVAAGLWPRPEERRRGLREPLDVPAPRDDGGFWVARAEALPARWAVSPDRLVWAAGGTTWRRLAARGIWVHGSADGLGEESPDVDVLASRTVRWHRLTHRLAAEADPTALATYLVDERLPEDLPSRTHFFWSSGTLFRQAIERWPQIRDRWHGCGPGRTWRTVRDMLGSNARVRVWLDYDQWHKEILG